MMARIVIANALLLGFLAPAATAHVPEHEPGGFHSPILELGDTWSWTFNRTGMFYYHCHQHPFMEGSVDVKDGGPMAGDGQIKEYQFAPGLITVGVGGNVTWHNNDNDNHTVVQSKALGGSTTTAESPGLSLMPIIALVALVAIRFRRVRQR